MNHTPDKRQAAASRRCYHHIEEWQRCDWGQLGFWLSFVVVWSSSVSLIVDRTAA